MKTSSCDVSIIIPIFNEELSLPLLCSRLQSVATKLPKRTELWLIDDGSSDQTVATAQKLRWPWPTQVVSFSRNFGHQAALLAGLEQAQGKCVITMDGDLQHPPELLPEFWRQYKQGTDIVFTQRLDVNRVPWLKKWLTAIFYKVIGSMAQVQIRPNASDFRALSRPALNALLTMPERRKFLRGMVGWIGFSSTIIPFVVEERAAGHSKYTFRKMVNLGLAGLTAFSTVPLYFTAWASVALGGLAVVYAAYVLFVRFVWQAAVAGWSSVIFVTLVVGCVLSWSMAVVGIYLAAIYDEVKARPIYVVKSAQVIKRLPPKKSPTPRVAKRKKSPNVVR